MNHKAALAQTEGAATTVSAGTRPDLTPILRRILTRPRMLADERTPLLGMSDGEALRESTYCQPMSNRPRSLDLIREYSLPPLTHPAVEENTSEGRSLMDQKDSPASGESSSSLYRRLLQRRDSPEQTQWIESASLHQSASAWTESGLDSQSGGSTGQGRLAREDLSSDDPLLVETQQLVRSLPMSSGFQSPTSFAATRAVVRPEFASLPAESAWTESVRADALDRSRSDGPREWTIPSSGHHRRWTFERLVGPAIELPDRGPARSTHGGDLDVVRRNSEERPQSVDLSMTNQLLQQLVDASVLARQTRLPSPLTNLRSFVV